MGKEFLKTVWNKEKFSKRAGIEKQVFKRGLEEAYQEYKHKLQSKTNPKLHHLARVVFSDFLLLLKSKNGICTCVTCGKQDQRDSPNMHPGHYRKQGSCLLLKFVEDNVRPQCARCNVILDGNMAYYCVFIQKTLGYDVEKYMRTTQEQIKYRDADYARMIIERWEQIKTMKQQLDGIENANETLAFSGAVKKHKRWNERFPTGQSIG